jgi:hypothetical protein
MIPLRLTLFFLKKRGRQENKITLPTKNSSGKAFRVGNVTRVHVKLVKLTDKIQGCVEDTKRDGP